MSSQPIPILVTGKAEQVGQTVVSALGPEYEVIHYTLAAAITDELPSLLTGKIPPNQSSSLGSGNWSAPPQALLIGGAYQTEDVERIQKLADNTEGAATIPWLRVDSSKGAPAPASLNPSDEAQLAQVKEYGTSVAGRMKEKLNELRAEGKLGPGNGGVYLV